MLYLDWAGESIETVFKIPTCTVSNKYIAASVGPSKLNRGPGADLESRSCFSLVEMESQLPLLGTEVPSSPGKACLEKALLQMGLKPPCFFPQCSPTPRNTHPGVREHTPVWAWFCLLKSPSFIGLYISPSLWLCVPVFRWVMPSFTYRNTNWCGGCSSLLGNTASRKGFWNYVCTCLYECMSARVPTQATVTMRCVVCTRVRFSLISRH